jgi:hypothetical protein
MKRAPHQNNSKSDADEERVVDDVMAARKIKLLSFGFWHHRLLTAVVVLPRNKCTKSCVAWTHQAENARVWGRDHSFISFVLCYVIPYTPVVILHTCDYLEFASSDLVLAKQGRTRW